MHVILLGTAAGGGFPQWNCRCATCRLARDDPGRAHPRTQSSIAVSADGARWFLGNASPDVRAQIAHIPAPDTAAARYVSIEGIVLTDAELDHTLGIAMLREARHLRIYASAAVLAILEDDSRLLPVTRCFADVAVETLPTASPAVLRDRTDAPAGLTVEMLPVAGTTPRFATHAADHAVYGLMLRSASGRTLAYVPGCGALDAATLARLREADLVLFDGTFWREDELTAAGLSDRPASAMGHVPIGGADGSLTTLETLPGQCVYVHINNTNPVLVEDSAERRQVEAAGLRIGMDGDRFTL